MFRDFENKLPFTSATKKLLQNLVIGENQPGTILHDFEIILDIFRDRKQTLTPAYQLPLVLLSEINQQVKRPVRLALKRPHPKSYPHVQGLYLLLRSSGLSYVDASGKKPALVIDPAFYEQWQNLNPYERYGTLLEAWLLRGFPDILDEHSRAIWSIPNNFDEIAFLLSRYDLKAGLEVAGNREVETGLNYYPGRYNLGLLNLFGFMDIQSGIPQLGEGWRIERITLTPVGEAFLALLYNQFFSKSQLIVALDDEPSVGVFQNILKPYFPEWQHNLAPSQTPFREGAHIFKVSLDKAWRRIAIDAKQPLTVLASVILESVNFDEDHLYNFSYRNHFGRLEQIYHEYMEDEPLLASEVRVGDLPLSVGQNVTFLFDFGDNWEFDLLLEAVDAKRMVKNAEIIESHGEAPEQYPFFDDDDFEDEEFEDEEDE